MNKPNIFVITYNSAESFFSSKFNYPEYFNYYVIDNGRQEYKNTLGCPIYSCEKNIGCAGGWNLACSIAFDSLNLNEIMITQDDAYIEKEYIDQAFLESAESNITGVIQPYFEFSCFVITKKVWKTVGYFDENFKYVYCEDADYKHRCYLNNIYINSLNVDITNRNFSSSIIKDSSIDKKTDNLIYLINKWGKSVNPSNLARDNNQAPFENKIPKFILNNNNSIEEYSNFVKSGFHV